ncbi:MAG: hypothetical protein H7Y10_03750 [Flavobacterium sp.]|nr:hypothetical protein [Flavobacterium sp.]
MKAKAINGIISKGINFRVEVILMEGESGEKFFFVTTKRLTDFKTRNITKTENVYSVETFAVLAHISNFFIEHPTIKNKVLLKELSKIKPANTSTDLKTH